MSPLSLETDKYNLLERGTATFNTFVSAVSVVSTRIDVLLTYNYYFAHSYI
jgi:hypothetical protein